MSKYALQTVTQVRILRSEGKTYTEIKHNLGLEIPKSTLSDWCKEVILPKEYIQKIKELNKTNSHKGRIIALITNKIKRKKFLDEIKKNNESTAKEIHKINTAKIALAMLCLG